MREQGKTLEDICTARWRTASSPIICSCWSLAPPLLPLAAFVGVQVGGRSCTGT